MKVVMFLRVVMMMIDDVDNAVPAYDDYDDSKGGNDAW